MMNKFTQLRTRGVALKSALAAAAFSSAVGAHAALPAWAANLGTDIGASIDDTSDAVGPLVIAALVSLIVIKLIKRFANKI